MVALGANCHKGKPLICADYETQISADQRPEGSEDQRLIRKLTRRDSLSANFQSAQHH